MIAPYTYTDILDARAIIEAGKIETCMTTIAGTEILETRAGRFTYAFDEAGMRMARAAWPEAWLTDYWRVRINALAKQLPIPVKLHLRSPR